MGMYEVLKALRCLLRPRIQVDAERALDDCIRDALLEDAFALPPVGAWDRLLKVITDGRLRRGMWVLDETLHDPPENARLALSVSQHRRAERLYQLSLADQNRQVREAVWDTLLPTFASLVNW